MAVISRDTAEFNDVAVGDTITINLGDLGEADFEIIGTYQAISPDVFSTDPIYAPAPAVVGVTRQANRANQVVIRTTYPGQAPQIVITMPLLEGLDGVAKMSKCISPMRLSPAT